MRITSFVTVLALLIPFGFVYGEPICNESSLNKIRSCLQLNYKPKKVLDYKKAREVMFSEIDNRDGKVLLVYSGKWFETKGIPNHNVVNTEHTWPQSKFSGKSLKSDLHHLYPTYSIINSTRGSHPFGDIPDESTENWMNSNKKASSIIPPLTVRDEYSEYYKNIFEPRENHKGEVARSMFYVYAVYDDKEIKEEWFFPQVATLLKWHNQYPVTDVERIRTREIEKVQGNINPFVLDETLAERLFSEE